MLYSQADVFTDAPQRYAKQLVSHLGRRLTVHRLGGPSDYRLDFDYGAGLIIVKPDRLVLRAAADDEESLTRVQDVFSQHLERFGRNARIVVRWTDMS